MESLFTWQAAVVVIAFVVLYKPVSRWILRKVSEHYPGVDRKPPIE